MPQCYNIFPGACAGPLMWGSLERIVQAALRSLGFRVKGTLLIQVPGRFVPSFLDPFQVSTGAAKCKSCILNLAPNF